MIERRLKVVVDLPTAVLIRKEGKIENYKDNKDKDVQDLSIIRQSLLFEDERATEMIFKIADIVNLGMDDYVSN